MTVPLDDLFADLRAGTIPAVRPPGVDAARRTVRRRRQTRLVVVAAAVLTLAGGSAWLLQPDAIPAAGPTPTKLIEVARAAVDRSADGPVLLARDGLSRGTDEVTMQPGRYLLVAACAANASGQLMVTVRPPAHVPALTVKWVPCDSAPTALRFSFRVLKPAVITVDIGALTTPGGQAGYAYRLVRDPTESTGPSRITKANAARALDLVTAAGGVFARRGFTSEVDQRAWVGRFRTQTAVLRLSCAGPGAVRVVVLRLADDADPADPIVGTTLADRSLACTAAGVTIKVPVTITATSSLGLELRADAAARNRAGYATAVDIA